MPLLKLHVNRIIKNAFFCIRLISLRIIPISLIHIVASSLASLSLNISCNLFSVFSVSSFCFFTGPLDISQCDAQFRERDYIGDVSTSASYSCFLFISPLNIPLFFQTLSPLTPQTSKTVTFYCPNSACRLKNERKEES